MVSAGTTTQAINSFSQAIDTARRETNAARGAEAKISQVTSSSLRLAPNRSRSRTEWIPLRNGSKVPRISVLVTLINLEKFSDITGSVGLYELKEKCHHPDYQMHRPYDDIATMCRLTRKGKVHDITRHILLSSIEGEGAELHIGDPVDLSLQSHDSAPKNPG